jgi:hypothetical protein
MGLLRAVGRTAVVAGTATAVSNRVSRRQANRWSSQEEQQYAEQAPPPAAAPAAPAAPSEDDVIAQIEKLGALKEKGLLTEEEFTAQKAKLLGM